MATQAPLRCIRIPALQRQCLFLRHQRLNRPLAAAASRAFSSTPSHARAKATMRSNGSQTRAVIKNDVGPSPRVNVDKMQRSQSTTVEDIGVLQGTMVRASLSELPRVTTRAFWGYFWALLKSKGLALYSRSVYRRMIQKKKLSRFLPVDMLGNKALKERAQNMYKHMYTSFAEGDIEALEKMCLPPVLEQFQKRLELRKKVEVKWDFHEWKSVKVMSHRSAPLGEEHPDTAYRQAIIRLESLQSTTRKLIKDSIGKLQSKSKASLKPPAWAPDEARERLKNKPKAAKTEIAQESEPAVEQFADNGKTKEVVEYMVLQKQCISGVEGEWKIQGFTEVSTPEKIESDEKYWSRQLATQAKQVGA